MKFAGRALLKLSLVALLANCGGADEDKTVSKEENKEEQTIEKKKKAPKREKKQDGGRDEEATTSAPTPQAFEEAESIDTPAEKSFLEYCLDASVFPTERATLDAMMAATSSKDCAELASQSLSLETLNLSNKDIVELAPVAYLVSLKNLSLAKNHITRIDALRALKKLRILDVSANQIPDVSALKGLTSLETVVLSENPIGDLKVLDSNPALRVLYFDKDEPYVFKASSPDGDSRQCESGVVVDLWNACRHNSHGVELYKEAASDKCPVKETIYKKCHLAKHGWEDGGRWQKDSTEEKFTKKMSDYDRKVRDFIHEKCTPVWKSLQEELIKEYSSPVGEIRNLSNSYHGVNEVIRSNGSGLVRTIEGFKCRVSYEYRRGKKKENKACGVAEIKYEKCRDASHGVALYNVKTTAACGTTGSIVEMIGSQMDTIPAELGKPMSCAACENLPVTKTGEVGAKLSCLSDIVSSKANGAIKGKARGALTRLYEEKTSFFTKSDVATYLNRISR